MSFELKIKTEPNWLNTVFSDFDSFLLDHAACERKASALGISLVLKYPDKTLLIDPLIQFAREELEHFHLVYKVLLKRNLKFKEDEKDDYVVKLNRLISPKQEERFLDRLLIASIIEARGTERLGLVSQNIDDPELKKLYEKLTKAELGHQFLFHKLASFYFDTDTIQSRLDFLLDEEAKIINTLPLLPKVH